MSGPLTGVRVLDLSTVVMGPYATQILGDYGADVIKVERPGGDVNRYVTPGRSRGMSGLTLTIHRNKRSIVLDLKSAAGREALDALVARTDILIHNMLPDVVRSLGLDYERLHARHPALVYCVATGFGEDGPYSGQPAYDDLIQGASGIASLMSGDGDAPRYFPAIVCDKVTGLNVVNAVLAAYVHRQSTGEGQKVTVPMFETMLAFNLLEHAGDSVLSPYDGEIGYARVLSPHRRPYPTADGYICVLPYSDREWRTFFGVVGKPDLADDTRFADIGERTRNSDALYETAGSLLGSRTTDEWLQVFADARIAAMPVYDLAAAQQDPHIVESGFIAEREHPSEGTFRETGIPVAFSQSPPDRPTPAPRLGEHTEELLAELGLSGD